MHKRRKVCVRNGPTNPKTEYWANVFKEVINILQSTEFSNDDILTIKYVADTHKSLQSRINSRDTRGTFPTPDLSFSFYEKLISLIAKTVMTQIKRELIDGLYFSITINSVPDTNESAIYIRYVDDTGLPKKIFLDIVHLRGDNALQLMNILQMILDKYKLNHRGFMGLSYDIDSNIPKYRDSLKTCLKSINEFAEIMPCSSDPISLVVIKAASSCYEGNEFFTTIDELFNFFLFFKNRWGDIQFLLKNLTYEQFSTKIETCRCLNENWSMIVYALFHISENKSFPRKMCVKAYILLHKVKRLETCFIAMFWEDIIGQITEHEENLIKYLSTKTNFREILQVYLSLITCFNDFRTNEKCKDYMTRALKKSNILHFNNRNRVENPQMRFPVDYMDEGDQFKIETYFQMIDEIQSELEYRKTVYSNLATNFNFLNGISAISDAESYHKLENLQSIYLDLTHHISTECNELRSILFKKKIKTTTIRDVSCFINQRSYRIFFKDLGNVIRMALSISATDCKVEHSTMSVLKKVITLKSTTSEDTYNSLLLINMDQELLKRIDFQWAIHNFTRSQSAGTF